MKDCYAVHLIRWFNSLPEKDTRGRFRRFWHWLRKVDYHTQARFFAEHPDGLNRNLIDNRHAWSAKELGYADPTGK